MRSQHVRDLASIAMHVTVFALYGGWFALRDERTAHEWAQTLETLSDYVKRAG